jgi:acetyl-CoA carboxylase biotin carboxylase subunit
LKKLLIADRGVAALRIIRACRELNIPSVLVYSEADRDALPVQLADEAVCIGPGPAADSYLNVSRVLSAAEITHCDSVHPGCGVLADSPEFADATASLGLRFVGPDADTLRRTRDRIAARRLAREHGLPVIAGSEGEVADPGEAARLCSQVGFPVMVKTATGGGPRSRHVIRREKDLDTGFRMAQADARAEFGDNRVYIEKLLRHAHHVEVPVLADRHGNVVALPERDCSVQFRWRILLAESPSPAVGEEQRRQLGAWAVTIARAAGLVNVGVVEFLGDESGSYHFSKLSCRLHADHPVTEMVTGRDIVRSQLSAASGTELNVPHPERSTGHALAGRINSEDPDAGFEPATGLITDVRLPGGPGVRVDACISAGYQVPPFYDTMLATITCWAKDRDAAIARMERALAESSISGVATTLGLHRRLMQSGRFRRGKLAVGMLDEELGA